MDKIAITIEKTDKHWDMSVLCDKEVIMTAFDVKHLYQATKYLETALDTLKDRETKEEVDRLFNHEDDSVSPFDDLPYKKWRDTPMPYYTNGPCQYDSATDPKNASAEYHQIVEGEKVESKGD